MSKNLPGVCGGDGVGLHVQDGKVLNGVGMPLTETVLQPDRIPFLQFLDVSAVGCRGGWRAPLSLPRRAGRFPREMPVRKRAPVPMSLESTIWSTSWRGIVSRSMGTPSKLFQGRWSSPVLIVLYQAYCRSYLGNSGFKFNLKGLETKIPSSQQQNERQEKNGGVFSSYPSLDFEKVKGAQQQKRSITRRTSPCLSRFARNSP